MAGPTVVSHSEMQTGKRCAFKHQVFYVERWTGDKDPMSALGKGSAWHLVMEEHYNTIRALVSRHGRMVYRNQARLLGACREAVLKVMEPMDDELSELIWWMYEGYVALYGADEDWEILAVEHPAEVRLPTPSGGRSQFVLKMKIDLIIRERGSSRRIRVVDHKSGKDLPGAKALELDDQFGLYTWGLNKLGKRVFGQTYNAARTLRLQADIKEPGTTPLAERFARVPLYRTPRELDNLAVETYLTARALYRQQREVKKLGVDAPRTTDPLRCKWDCDAYQACLAGRKGLDWRAILRAQNMAQNFERH